MSRESPEARAERILAELREATREAAGVLKDLAAAQKSAREQVDDYLGKGVQDALNFYKSEVEKVGQHYADCARKDMAEHLVGFTAVVQNEISRTAIFKEAVDSIIKELQRHDEARQRQAELAASGIAIELCQRPHTD